MEDAVQLGDVPEQASSRCHCHVHSLAIRLLTDSLTFASRCTAASLTVLSLTRRTGSLASYTRSMARVDEIRRLLAHIERPGTVRAPGQISADNIEYLVAERPFRLGTLITVK